MKHLLTALTAAIAILTTANCPAQNRRSNVTMPPVHQRHTQGNLRSPKQPIYPIWIYSHYPRQSTWIYYYRPYNRKGWTNYRVQDTSWGYRRGRPRASDLGIRGPHKYGHPNPRSLYR